MTLPKIGVSPSLLASPPRFDDGGRNQQWIIDRLGNFAELLPISEDISLVLCLPPEDLRLSEAQSNLCLIGTNSSEDHDQPIHSLSEDWLTCPLDGVILDSILPSEGPTPAQLDDERPLSDPKRTGQFAQYVFKQYPLLPFEEDRGLKDPLVREHFIVQILAHMRLKALFESQWTWSDLVAFHSREKTLLLAQCPATLKKLGALVAQGPASRGEVTEHYPALFMQAIKERSSRGKHANALSHLAGFFKKQVGSTGRRSVAEIIENYRIGKIARDVPLSVIRSIGTVYSCTWLLDQSYLSSTPESLGLDNWVPG